MGGEGFLKATNGLKCTSETWGGAGGGRWQCAKDFVSLVGNDDSQNKLNKSLLIVECCSGLGLIKIGKSKRLKRVWFGGIRRAFSALGLPGRGCGIRGYRGPETVIGTSSTPVGNWGAFPLGRRNPQHRPWLWEVYVEGCMGTSLVCGLLGMRAVLLVSGTPSPAPIHSRRKDSYLERL